MGAYRVGTAMSEVWEWIARVFSVLRHETTGSHEGTKTRGLAQQIVDRKRADQQGIEPGYVVVIIQ